MGQVSRELWPGLLGRLASQACVFFVEDLWGVGFRGGSRVVIEGPMKRETHKQKKRKSPVRIE